MPYPHRLRDTVADLASSAIQDLSKRRCVGGGCGQDCGQRSVRAGRSCPPTGCKDHGADIVRRAGRVCGTVTCRVDDCGFVRLDKGTLLIAGAATVAAVVLATKGGPVALVLVAVAAGVAAAALWQLRLNGLDVAAREAESEKAEEVFALPGPARDGGVVQFLRPGEEVMPFWPRPELDDLFHWVASARHVAVQLVIGEGGTGRTRLARQLADRAIGIGFRSWWVRDGTEQVAVRMATAAGKPALLVVDYAETRSGLRELIAEAVNSTAGPDVRVLVLARSAGEWWEQLISSSGYQASELLAAVQPITLGPVSDGPHQSKVFQQAMHAFADKLNVACPDVEIMRADPGAVVLVIHAAALLAVLDHADARSAPGQPRGRTDVLAGLLRHEARYWQRSQRARGLGLDTEVTRRAIALGCLVGADDETSAVELLTAIRDLSDPAVRGKAARWLRDLYPVPPSGSGQREWMGSLQPDLIVEQLVVSVLGQQPDLIPALFAGLAERRASRALTILARAALTDPAAGQQLESALNSDLEHLAVPALAVAVETNPAVGSMIRSALSAGNAVC